MKNLIYTFVVGISISFSSCSKGNEDDLPQDQLIITSECLPFIDASFSQADVFPFPTDPSTLISGHRQIGDCLILDTRFGGGCEDHLLQLVIDLNSSAVNINQSLLGKITHENTDVCEATVALEVHVDISRLKSLNQNVIALNIDEYDQIIELVF